MTDARQELETVVGRLWALAQERLSGRKAGAAFSAARAVSVLIPDISRPMMLCGLCLAPLAQAARALVMLRRAYVLDPGDPLVQVRLAEALFASGAFEEAESMIREALSAGVEPGGGHFVLSRILWAQGRIDEAESELAAAASTDAGREWERGILAYTVRPEDFG